ncbi:hypothetical protein AHAS_Ahas05G0092600 [Arachis hypogaea]
MAFCEPSGLLVWVCSVPLWQHKPYQLTCIATLFGEYSAMTRAGYTTNGSSNGGTATTVICEIDIYNLSSTLPRLLITRVSTLDYTGCF